METPARDAVGAIRQVAAAIDEPGGLNAVNLKIAEQYVSAFSGLARTNNTLIVPSNLADVAALVTAATTVFKSTEQRPAPAQRA